MLKFYPRDLGVKQIQKDIQIHCTAFKNLFYPDKCDLFAAWEDGMVTGHPWKAQMTERQLKYLDYEFGLGLLDFARFGLGNTWTWFRIAINLMPLEKCKDFLDLSIKDLTNYLSVRGLNTSSRKVGLVAREYLI